MRTTPLKQAWLASAFCAALMSLSACGASDGSLKLTDTPHIQSGDALPGSVNSGDANPASTPLPTPTPARSTQGTGGALGLVEDSYTAVNGLSGKIRLQVPQDHGPGHPHGLLVYLHGDGGKDYDWFFDDVKDAAEANGLIAMSARSPNDGAAWYKNGEKQAEYLDEVLQKRVFPQYDITFAQVVFVGASGGSQFLTGQFIPKYGANYEGGSLQMCGGPRNWLANFPAKPEFLKRFTLAFYTQRGDMLFPQVEQGIAYYESQGMQVLKELPDGTGHCAFKMKDVVKKYVPLILAKSPS